MQIEDRYSRRSEVVNYCEGSDDEDGSESNEVVEMIISETIEKAANSEAINKKKQLKKVLNKEDDPDWKVDESKTLPKGRKDRDCYSFYVNLHPGVCKLFCACI